MALADRERSAQLLEAGGGTYYAMATSIITTEAHRHIANTTYATTRISASVLSNCPLAYVPFCVWSMAFVSEVDSSQTTSTRFRILPTQETCNLKL